MFSNQSSQTLHERHKGGRFDDPSVLLGLDLAEGTLPCNSLSEKVLKTDNVETLVCSFALTPIYCPSSFCTLSPH